MRRLIRFARSPFRTVDLPIWVYNVDNYRADIKQVAREIRAILGSEPVAILGLCETVGYRHTLPQVDGYVLDRDISNESRENISAYVRRDLYGGHDWTDLHERWSRTKGRGKHPSRSILKVRLARVPVFVAHQPPLGTDNTWAAQWEGINTLTRLMKPWTHKAGRARWISRRRPRVLIWDANRRPGQDGPGPTYLARKIGGEVVGHKIDCAVIRNGRASHVEYPTHVGGVKLESDHRHAFRFTLTVREKWTRRKGK